MNLFEALTLSRTGVAYNVELFSTAHTNMQSEPVLTCIDEAWQGKIAGENVRAVVITKDLRPSIEGLLLMHPDRAERKGLMEGWEPVCPAHPLEILAKESL